MAVTRERASAHDPGRVLRDVAVMLADGGDCVSDIGQWRDSSRCWGRRRLRRLPSGRSKRSTLTVWAGFVGQELRPALVRGMPAPGRTADAGYRRDVDDRALGEGPGRGELQAWVRVLSAGVLAGGDRRTVGRGAQAGERGVEHGRRPLPGSPVGARSDPCCDLGREMLVRADTLAPVTRSPRTAVKGASRSRSATGRRDGSVTLSLRSPNASGNRRSTPAARTARRGMGR